MMILDPPRFKKKTFLIAEVRPPKLNKQIANCRSAPRPKKLCARGPAGGPLSELQGGRIISFKKNFTQIDLQKKLESHFLSTKKTHAD